MTWAGCAGVETLHGQVVLFTGKTYMNGDWETKKTCGRVAEQNGATWVENESRRITLLVLGDLTTQIVTDMILRRSAKLIFVHRERGRGHHICVVDGHGFTALSNGNTARCLTLEPAINSSDFKAYHRI